MTRILCTGDLHLGASPEFGREPHGPDSRLADQARGWERIWDAFRDHDCDLMLFAGDAFHRRRPSPSEIVAFQHAIDPGNLVVAIQGNHDVQHPDLPSALSIFHDDIGGWFTVSSTPEILERAGVTVATLPWTPASRLVAQRGGGDRDEVAHDVASILVDVAARLRERCPVGQPAILLGHWSVSGATLPAGMLTDELREPVIPLSELYSQGWDAVILGHIHRPQHLADPLIGYVGSPMVVDWGETGHDHGVVIFDTDTSDSTFVHVPNRRFVTFEFDNPDDGLGFSGDVDGAVVRVRYRATREQAAKIDNHQIVQDLLSLGAWRVFVQPQIEREHRARVEGVDTDLDPAAALDMWLEHHPTVNADAVRAQHARYLAEVGT